MDDQAVEAYMCDKCYRVYETREGAEKCCMKGTCRVCGQVTEHWWQTVCCDECARDFLWLNPNNTFIRASDYDEPVWYKDRIFGTVDELLSETGGELPASGVFGTFTYRLEVKDYDWDDWKRAHVELYAEVEKAAEDEWHDFLKRYNDKWAPFVAEKDEDVSICRDDDPRAGQSSEKGAA